MGKFYFQKISKKFIKIFYKPYLTRLANKYGSDKGTKHERKHNYTHVYDKLFKPLRKKKINLLEIGLQFDTEKNNCPSLNMWADYFPKARIYGFDIRDFSSINMPRIKIFKGNQGKRDDLIKLINGIGSNLDIIIDDGSHAPHHQQISLAYLFPLLKNKGLYIIEDLHWMPETITDEPEYYKTKYMPTKDIFKGYIRNGVIKSNVIDRDQAKYLERNISNCEFYSSQSPLKPHLDHKNSLLVIFKK